MGKVYKKEKYMINFINAISKYRIWIIVIAFVVMLAIFLHWLAN